jgi:hypothetical protein
MTGIMVHQDYHQGLWFCNEWVVADKLFRVELQKSSEKLVVFQRCTSSEG